MSKIKMLLDVVERMRSLADSVEVLAQGIADGDNRKQISKVLSEKDAAPSNTKEADSKFAIATSLLQHL